MSRKAEWEVDVGVRETVDESGETDDVDTRIDECRTRTNAQRFAHRS
ncbi:hypothetical protein [Halorubrum aidingense]|nr:hypothetical protein [Halorubrum aidingense]